MRKRHQTAQVSHEHDSQAKIQSRQKTEESSNARTHDAHPVETISCRIGDSACAAKHATVIQRTGLFHPMNHRQKVQSLLKLQKQYGNRFVQRVIAQHVIQTKMQVSQPGDAYEQEADRVADTVMSMPEPQATEESAISGQARGVRIQRLCPACEKKMHRQTMEDEEQLSMRGIGDEEEVQMQSIEEEEPPLQTKTIADRPPEVAPNFESPINAMRGGGKPLPKSDRAFFEPRFGYGFSQVRVHTGSEADTLNRSLNARAFTTGQDIFFRQGEYNPGSSAGRKLLAHELTHVVQQSGTKTRQSSHAVRRIDNTPEQAPRIQRLGLAQEEKLHRQMLEEEEQDQERVRLPVPGQPQLCNRTLTHIDVEPSQCSPLELCDPEVRWIKCANIIGRGQGEQIFNLYAGYNVDPLVGTVWSGAVLDSTDCLMTGCQNLRGFTVPEQVINAILQFIEALLANTLDFVTLTLLKMHIRNALRLG